MSSIFNKISYKFYLDVTKTINLFNDGLRGRKASVIQENLS